MTIYSNLVEPKSDFFPFRSYTNCPPPPHTATRFREQPAPRKLSTGGRKGLSGQAERSVIEI